MIREAIQSDLENISTILEEVHNLHQENRPDMFKILKKPIDMIYYHNLITDSSSKIYIYIEGGIVSGYMTLKLLEINNHPVINDKKIVKIEDLAVLKKYQGKGIGTLLFKKAVEYVNEIQADKLDLQVWDFNISAKEFYKKQGMNVKSQSLEYHI